MENQAQKKNPELSGSLKPGFNKLIIELTLLRRNHP